MPLHVIETYKTASTREYRVLVVRIVSPDQVLKSDPDSIHSALVTEGLTATSGLYFYRFATLSEPESFSKIGEVSRKDGVGVRKYRGWLAPNSYGDSYKKLSTSNNPKGVHRDILAVSEDNPMYFIFYEFDVENSFPKIDEIQAFARHRAHFGRSTTNKEACNTFERLGKNLVWYAPAFNEVLNLQLPSGQHYGDAI
jgi:hypothetical protein